MPKPLVIVDSPAKAKTIAGFLGSGYAVESSIGHIRDLPRKAQEVPAAYKDEPWAKRWGVDVDNDFKPLYVVPAEKKAQVTKLKALLKEVESHAAPPAPNRCNRFRVSDVMLRRMSLRALCDRS